MPNLKEQLEKSQQEVVNWKGLCTIIGVAAIMVLLFLLVYGPELFHRR